MIKHLWCRLCHRRWYYVDKANDHLRIMHCVRCDNAWAEEM